MDFCETTSNTIIKTCAKFHFVMNLFQVIMTVDLTTYNDAGDNKNSCRGPPALKSGSCRLILPVINRTCQYLMLIM